MEWTDWSSIAEIIGSGAIVVTLVYLSHQIRQSTAAMQSAAREATAAGDAEWLYKLVDHQDLGELFRKKEPLSETEASRLNACLVAFMRLKEVNFRQYKTGVLDEDTWSNYRSSIVDGPLAQPNARAWWVNFGRHLFDQELSTQISQELSSTPVPLPFSALFEPIKEGEFTSSNEPGVVKGV